MSTQARVLFRLSMPGVGSWNGKWSGSNRNYTITKRMGKKQLAQLGLDIPGEGGPYWEYSFDDGWRAGIEATVVETGVRIPKSEGFCGYDWMVDNIIRWGHPECKHAWGPDPVPPRPDGEWERCRRCRTSRLVTA